MHLALVFDGGTVYREKEDKDTANRIKMVPINGFEHSDRCTSGDVLIGSNKGCTV